MCKKQIGIDIESWIPVDRKRKEEIEAERDRLSDI
jgi:hypothetical protein